MGQKKYADALPLFLAGIEGMKKQPANLPPPGRPRRAEAALRLVQLYEATGQTDEAAKWQKEPSAIKTPQKKLEKQP